MHLINKVALAAEAEPWSFARDRRTVIVKYSVGVRTRPDRPLPACKLP